jgi:hypothetical protein
VYGGIGKMDAYNIYHLIKSLWAEHVNKYSGLLEKSSDRIKICVWTEEGYREVTNVHYNDKLKFIELELDRE